MNIDQAFEILRNLQQSVSLPGKDHDLVRSAIETLYGAAKAAEGKPATESKTPTGK